LLKRAKKNSGIAKNHRLWLLSNFKKSKHFLKFIIICKL
jgi:hypothetical protein